MPQTALPDQTKAPAIRLRLQRRVVRLSRQRKARLAKGPRVTSPPILWLHSGRVLLVDLGVVP